LSDSLKKTFQSNLGKLDNAEMMQWLNKTIESEIIPRLLMGHSLESYNKNAANQATGIKVDQTQIDDFCQILLDGPIEDCLSYIATMQKSGYSLVSLYMDLIPASTRRLQLLWETDENSFTEVTMALGRAQNMIHQLSPLFMHEANFTDFKGKALLVNAPGSQHTLGILILSEFLKINGWNTTVDIEITDEDVKERVRLQAYDLLGISISCEDQWDTVEALLAEVKHASKNKGVLTMVGGPLLDYKPELMDNSSADICALTPEEAMKKVSEFMTQRNALN